MAVSPLRSAEKRFKASRYSDVVKLLEPQIVKYRESSRFYYLLGASCLYAGDFGGAYTYLKRSEQIKSNTDIQLGLGILELRRGETEKALRIYLDILETEPGNRKAKKALELMRRNPDREAISAWLEKGEAPKIYPKGGRNPVWKWLIILGFCMAGIFAAYLGYREIRAQIPSPRPEISAIILDPQEKKDSAVFGGSYRYPLDEKQVVESFEKAKALFGAYKDNAALVEVNRLVNSNASPSIKNKALLLKSFVSPPSFDMTKDSFDFKTVAKDPYLYEGCVVAWKGRISNFTAGKARTRLDLLVGYHDGKVLEGIIPVDFDFEVSADPVNPMEILGMLQVMNGALSMKGLAVHELLAK